MLDAFQSNDRKVFRAAPVGFAKSSTLRSFTLWNLLCGARYQLYVSSTSQKSKEHMSSFGNFLSSKHLVKELSDVLSESAKKNITLETIKSNTEELIVRVNGKDCNISAKSANSDLAGTNFQSIRPQVICIDDIEDITTCNSIEQTDKLWDWMNLILFARLPSLEEGLIRMIGTNLSPITICNKILTGELTGWNGLAHAALNENGRSIWEEHTSTKRLHEERSINEYYFAKNYMNKPIDSSDSPIKREDLRFYDKADISLDDFDHIFIHGDLTHTSKAIGSNNKKDPDFFCLCAMAEHKKNKNFYLLDFILSKELDPGKQAEMLLHFYSKYKSKVQKITFDEKGYASFGYWAEEKAKKDYGLSLPLEPLKYPSDKWTHFEPHIHHFKAHRVYFPSTHEFIDLATTQLLYFPKASKDDFVDGISGCMDNFQSRPIEIIVPESKFTVNNIMS